MNVKQERYSWVYDDTNFYAYGYVDVPETCSERTVKQIVFESMNTDPRFRQDLEHNTETTNINSSAISVAKIDIDSTYVYAGCCFRYS